MKDNKRIIRKTKDYILAKDLIVLSKSIKYHYQNPPLIGLINLGHTDYINTILQCFSNIEQLTNYFKYDSYIEQIIKNNPNSLTASYKLIIDKLWPTNNNHNNLFNKNISFSPNDFKNKILSMNSLFEGVRIYNDILRDLINFFIMTLSEELNKIEEKNNNFINNVDQTNKQFLLDYFIKDFKSSYNSIIVDLFYGINESSTKCLNCKIKKYNYQSYFFITPSLEEVWEFKVPKSNLDELLKNKTMNQKEIQYKIQFLKKNKFVINIKDCFDQFQTTDIFSGDNAMYCETCHQMCDATFQTVFYTLPRILIICLRRKRYGYQVKVIFNELLDLKDYGKNGGIYELISVISYLGNNDYKGHFIAACKSFIDNRWYRYNDAIVSEITNFEKDILNFGEPCALFYKRK